MIITSTHKPHQDACDAAELARQNAVAAAYTAGGSSATLQAAVRTGEIAYYRAVIASAKANGLPFNNFTVALLALGTGGA